MRPTVKELGIRDQEIKRRQCIPCNHPQSPGRSPHGKAPGQGIAQLLRAGLPPHEKLHHIGEVASDVASSPFWVANTSWYWLKATDSIWSRKGCSIGWATSWNIPSVRRRLGIATNRSFLPWIIFKSHTTNIWFRSMDTKAFTRVSPFGFK